MKNLVKLWEVHADQCEDRANAQANGYTQERLYAEATAYRVCADELNEAIKKEE